MRNILIIGIIIIGIGYMFVIMKDKYNTLNETNNKIAQQKIR